MYFTSAGLDRYRRNFCFKRSAFDSCLRTLHAGGGEIILLFAGKAVLGGTVFAKGAHGAAGFIGVFQAVEHHVVHHAIMADTDAAAAFEQQVRGVGHALHATCHQHIMATGHQHVVRKHDRAHARAAHLAQRHRARAIGQAALERCLARRGLTLARHQAVAKQHFCHQLWGKFGTLARTLQRSLDGHTPQIMGRQ